MHFAVVAFGDVKYLVQYVLSDCAEVSVDIGKYELGHGIGKLQFLHTPSWMLTILYLCHHRVLWLCSFLRCADLLFD